MGGLYTSIKGILFLVFAGFTKKLYFHSLIKRLYAYEASVSAESQNDDHRSKLKEMRKKSVKVSKEISVNNCLTKENLK